MEEAADTRERRRALGRCCEHSRETVDARKRRRHSTITSKLTKYATWVRMYRIYGPVLRLDSAIFDLHCKGSFIAFTGRGVLDPESRGYMFK